MELNNYLLDIVFAEDGQVRLRTFSIASTSAEAAFERFTNEESTDFPIVYEGELVSAIIVGISEAIPNVRELD